MHWPLIEDSIVIRIKRTSLTAAQISPVSVKNLWQTITYHLSLITYHYDNITTMTNSLGFRYSRYTCKASVVQVLQVVLFALLSIVVVQVVDAQTTQNYCGAKPCIEPIDMPCEEAIETYKFQGSCCSMEHIPQTNGCRITVSFGNCFWYPFCGDCDADDAKEGGRCNNIFETAADQRPCPAGDFDPLAIQSALTWSLPSCAPSMAPTKVSMPVNSGGGGGGASTFTRAAVLVAFIATAVFAA